MTAVRLAVVCSQFNGEITDRMLSAALARCREAGANVMFVCRVPGAFDMPLFIDELAGREDVDAVVTLGAIVTGETKHDEVIASSLASSITALSLKHGKPVSLGVTGPGMTWEEGSGRAEEYASRSVDAAMKMAASIARLRSGGLENERPAVIE